MSKIKKAFFCQNCGAQSAKWVGKCNSCGEWNTYVEEIIEKKSPEALYQKSKKTQKVIPIQEITEQKLVRYKTPEKEFNRVLGGGVVPGSLHLFGGEPGVGKSTLLLQLALKWKGIKLLYVSGEESTNQIKMRADRVGHLNPQCLVFAETNLENILLQLEEHQPDILIIDSIQTLYTKVIESASGSISQIRECAAQLMRYAKETNTPVFLIGHITKEGQIAGPKVLEHMVDVVLQFEGDRNNLYRLLRSTKNRFGPTNEIGIYQMGMNGLNEVENPSDILLSSREESLSGAAIATSIEGLRVILLEIQALVSSAAYGTPQRSSTSFDNRRLNMLLAVLEKRCGFKLAMKDVFLNIAGGIKMEDPAMDLAIIAAILSSNEDIPVHPHIAFAAEIGLSGEVRPVRKIEERLLEADKLGFKEMYISKYNANDIKNLRYSLKLHLVGRVEEVYQKLFG